MSDIQKKIDEIEAEMARTQKNKATNYHLGTLKAKLAKLRSELLNGPGGKSSGTKNAERGFDVTKSGDTRIGLGTFVRSFVTVCFDSIALHGVVNDLFSVSFLTRLRFRCFSSTHPYTLFLSGLSVRGEEYSPHHFNWYVTLTAL